MSEYPDEATDASRPKVDDKAQTLTGSSGGGTDAKPGEGAGEDDGGSPIEGEDSHLKDDQVPTSK